MTSTCHVSVDLGASSGRVVVGRLYTGGRVKVKAREVYRFESPMVRAADELYWDAARLQRETFHGLALVVAEEGAIASIGIDSWGVDYGLIDQDGQLTSNPRHYRDPRTERMMDRAFARVSRDDLFALTGIQSLPINTLYQLLASEGSPELQQAAALLLIPDLVTFWLTGTIGAERTIASTTQLLDVGTLDWAWSLIEAMELPAGIFPTIRPPGTVAGLTTPSSTETIGLADPVEVISVASHDTASAVVAVPAIHDRFAFVSCGTWSLVGVEVPSPVLSPAARDLNFTNEQGYDGTVRFLKNIMGLWLLQECVRVWRDAGWRGSVDDVVAAAAGSPAFGSVVDVNDSEFLRPGDMPSRLAAYCLASGQPVPVGIGKLARCIFESLALAHRIAIREAERLTDRGVDVVHMVGGGARNRLLCQLTADACERPVVAGPIEAAALGNILVQASTQGELSSLAEIREVVNASVAVDQYRPATSLNGWSRLESRISSKAAAVG